MGVIKHAVVICVSSHYLNNQHCLSQRNCIPIRSLCSKYHAVTCLCVSYCNICCHHMVAAYDSMSGAGRDLWVVSLYKFVLVKC